MLSRLSRALWVLLLLLPVCSFTDAQQGKKNAFIMVEVTDVTGAYLPGAEVEVEELSPAAKTVHATHETGRVMIELDAGKYVLSVKYTGFKHLTQQIEARAGETQKVHLVLQVGSCPPGCVEVTSIPPPEVVPSQSSGSNRKSIASTFSCTDRPYAKELPPPGPACETELFARRGRLFMFPARNGIAFGVSSSPDEPSTLSLWADNQTAEAVNWYFCCVRTLFDHIDIFDSQGHRVLSKTDQEELKARPQGREVVEACTCSGWFSVPPHTTKLFVFADISTEYTLSPGRYTVSERNPPSIYNLRSDEHEAAPHAPPGLAISIP